MTTITVLERRIRALAYQGFMIGKLPKPESCEIEDIAAVGARQRLARHHEGFDGGD
jgi:hypothetical protein